MRRAPCLASSSDALHLDCSLPRRAALAAVALAAVTFALGCGQKAEPPATKEQVPAASIALATGAPAPTATGALPAESSAIAPPTPSGSAAAAGSAQRPAAALVEPPRAPTSTGMTPPPPSALASAAPSVAPVATATPTVEVAAPVPTVESPKTAEASFNLWMQAAGKYKAGQPGVVQVVLVAQGGFHCNDKYPYKLKLGAPAPGVSYPEPIVRVERLAFTPARSVMTVPFVPSTPGDARIAGTFSFSVCTASSCQLETRDLAIVVKVE